MTDYYTTTSTNLFENLTAEETTWLRKAIKLLPKIAEHYDYCLPEVEIVFDDLWVYGEIMHTEDVVRSGAALPEEVPAH